MSFNEYKPKEIQHKQACEILTKKEALIGTLILTALPLLYILSIIAEG